MSLSSGSKTTKTNFSGQQDPWSPSIPYLEDFLQQVGAAGVPGVTEDQKYAFEFLKNNAIEGNPWDASIAQLATDAFATTDRTGQVGDAYTQLEDNIGSYASGGFLDPMSNPKMAAMLQQVGDEAQNRINAQFAAAGRDFSGANQGAVARGVTAAQTPVLFDQFNKQQQLQIDAASRLAQAGQNTAQQQAALDAARQAQRAQGVELGQAALDARNQGANEIIDIDNQVQRLPYENLALLASVLFPAGQLGQQSDGTQTAKSSSTGLGVNILSDERAKEGIELIATAPDGMKIYRWRYKGSEEVHIGPMAQEVEQRTPEAVTEDPATGLKLLNVDAATRKAAEVMKQRQAKKSGY